MPIPRTAAEWDADPDLFRLVKCYRGRESFHRLRLFAAACCRRIWDLIPAGPARDAVEAAERYASGVISLGELDLAGRRARAVVDGASEVPGTQSRVHGSLEETVALAAWSCTLSAERPALDAPAHVLGVASKRQFDATLRVADWKEATRASKAAFDAEMVGLVALLRELVGNPFR
jgi:hypothetical protein